MTTYYTIYNNNVPLATRVSYDVVCAMREQYPDTLTAKADGRTLFKYEVCFSTQVMNRASAHNLIERCVPHHEFPAYTVYDGNGSWHGEKEYSFTFTVTQEEDDIQINALAETFKDVFAQEAVLIIKTPVTTWLI